MKPMGAWKVGVLVLGLLCVLSWWAPALANGQESSPAPTGSEGQLDQGAGVSGAGEGASDSKPPEKALPWQAGPSVVHMKNNVILNLPDGYRYLGMPEADDVMKKMGNLHNEGLLGLVISSREEDSYFVTLRYEDSGYIKDDESLDADEILSSIREGEKEYNEERAKLGFTALHADGWQEPPRYNKDLHQLIWGLKLKDDEGVSVNYNTRILGRRGYVSVNLVTDMASLARDKPAAAKILNSTAFMSGARYSDFDSGSDKVAEYGLTGLVLGGAGLGLLKVAKIGLLAKFWNVIVVALLAAKKAVIVAVLAALGFVKKLFKRRQQGEA